MGLFANKTIEGKPVCPECEEVCEPDNNNVAASNSTGTWIMHPVCVFTHNERIKSDKSRRDA